MPRKARIDFPGALHHIAFHGIEKKPIFRDHKDYQALIDRLEECLIESNTHCYAWAMLPNHACLLIETGKKPLCRVMQSVLTSYALYFNKRYDRVGHLFQNRYQSILYDRKNYFVELIRYIHLTPLQKGVLHHLRELENFPWCGHGAIIGKVHYRWQNTEEILKAFDSAKANAIKKYSEFIQSGVEKIIRVNWEEENLGRNDGNLLQIKPSTLDEYSIAKS